MEKRGKPRIRPLGRLTIVAGAVALTVGLMPPDAAAQAVGEGGYVPGRLVVTTRAGVPDAALARVLGPHRGAARRIGTTSMHVVDVPAGAEVAVRDALARNPMFKLVELDVRFKLAGTTNDPYLGSSWHLSKINAPGAWDLAVGSGVTIAILDTGVDGSHPDLSERMVVGWNAYGNNSDSSDVHGHGTAVAGAAAATLNNGMGVAGVAGLAKIMPVRVTDASGYASSSTVAKGITFAADNGARVVNVSISGLPGNSTVQNAAQYMKSKGGLVVVAAGNDGVQLGIGSQSTMIPVSATDSSDSKTSWSNYGNFVAVAAPGLNIWSTRQGGSYWQCWGTSFSSPITAGVVALMMSARPDLSNSQVESLLYSTAVDLGSAGRDSYYGYGRVDAGAALAAVGGATAGDSQAPSTSITSPAGGASVNGLVAVDASASDNVGVTRVELRANGATVASDASAPYQFTWDTGKLANGSYTLEALAYDAVGNVGRSAGVAVLVANPVVADTVAPTVAIVKPANGSRVTGNVAISVKSDDNSGAANLRNSLYIDGVLVASSSGSSLSYKWNTRKAIAGTHTLQAVAQDAAGNKTSTYITVSK